MPVMMAHRVQTPGREPGNFEAVNFDAPAGPVLCAIFAMQTPRFGWTVPSIQIVPHLFAQAQAQALEGASPCPHMLAKTVLPPCVYTRAVTGSFSGAACAASLAGSADGGAAGAAAAAAPAEVVLATATSLLLLAVAPARAMATVAANAAGADPGHGAAAAGASAQNGASAAAEEGDGDNEATAAHAVLCEQPAFGTVVAMEAFRHPYAGRAQVGSSL